MEASDRPPSLPSRHQIVVTFRGREAAIDVDAGGALTLRQLVETAARRFGATPETPAVWAPESVKLLSRGVVWLPFQQPDAGRTLAEAALLAGPPRPLLLVASEAAEVARVREARDLPGMASFEAEDARNAARRRRRLPAGDGPPGKHFFGGFRVLQGPLSPAPGAALSLLHRLASDPAIVRCMERRGWTVGLLSEMPPEGRVGVSEVCVLGFNVNQGQEISLRLRTDDMRGFRKYLSIRQTLCHELAHNVFGPHDAQFKALNSQLLREVAEYEAAAGAPGRVLADAAARWGRLAGDGDDSDGGGQGGGGGAGGGRPPAGVRLGGSPVLGALGGLSVADAAPAGAAAGAAAVQRFQQQRAEQQRGAAAAAAVPLLAPPAEGLPDASAVRASVGSDGSGSAEQGCDEERAAQDAGHFDPVTAAKERAAVLLGSLDGDDAAPALGAGGDGGRPAGAGGCQGAGEAMAEPMAEPTAEQPGSRLPADAADPRPQPAAAATSGGATEAPPPEGPPLASIPAPAALAAQAPQPDPGASDIGALDSPSARKLAQARSVVQALHLEVAAAGEPPGCVAASLETAARVLANLVSQPNEARYQSLRLTNPSVARRIGRYSAARQLLGLAGFEEHGSGELLTWRRRDPGLAWLVLSVVRDAAADAAAAIAGPAG